MLDEMVKLGLLAEMAFTLSSKAREMNYVKNRRNSALRRWKSLCKDLEAGKSLVLLRIKKRRGVEHQRRD